MTLQESRFAAGAFSKYYGSKISSELLFPKILEILRQSPDIYQAADQFVEGADWMTWQITGTRMRSKSIATVAALWQEEEGYPSDDFLRALHPQMSDVKQKLRGKAGKARHLYRGNFQRDVR